MTDAELYRNLRYPTIQGIHLSERWRNWRSTQPWLADIIRASVAEEYAEVLQSDDTNTGGVHRNAVNAHVSKAFGALLSPDHLDLSISDTVDLLVRLGDLGELGEGYLIPRESRILVLPDVWARVAGGMPSSSSEHDEIGISDLGTGTVGRIVQTNDQFDRANVDTEHSELLYWMTENPDEIFTHLSRRLPERPSMEPVESSLRFYHAGIKSTTRRGRWQIEPSRELFVVARTGTSPVRYYVYFSTKPIPSRWFSLQKDDAKKWLLLAERYCLTTNRIHTERLDGQVTARLPDMLPDSWTVALLACSSAVIPIEMGWNVTIPANVWPLFQLILKIGNMRIP
jgi:hypothetical protein